MIFASIGHLIDEHSITLIPPKWIKKKYIISPELEINGTKGYIFALKRTASQIMQYNREKIRREILECILHAEQEYNIDLIQLGALTTSVTSGGKWVIEQNEFSGYINHGDSYTAAIAYQSVMKVMETLDISPHDCKLSLIGAYGIIGEALSHLLYHHFNETLLIGRRMEKLNELSENINDSVSISTTLDTKDSHIIVTATNHPTALLQSNHLKKDAIIIDVSQPPNLTPHVCSERPDIHRIDGGFVTFPKDIQLPAMPKGKILSCVAEIIMQAMENDKHNYVGSIDPHHLKRTIRWGEKYRFTLDELSNFGEPIEPFSRY